MRNSQVLALLLAVMLFASFSIEKDAYQVYVFLAPKCPICQDYSLKLKELNDSYAADGFTFIGVFPNDHSSEEDIEAFKEKYAIPFELRKGDKSLARELGASITPEVFIVNSEKETLYSGRIDNTYFRVGGRRTNTTTNDLEEAILSIKNNQPIAVANTQAIGCIIEY